MPTKPTGRPRGRPKSSKNIPKLEAFVLESITAPPLAVPIVPRGPPRGPWAGMTAEERSEYAKAIYAKRKTRPCGKPAGVPRRMTLAQYEAHQAAQAPVVAKIMKKLGERGQLPEHPWAVEALTAAMRVLRSPIGPKDKAAAGRLVLDFVQCRPGRKVDRPCKTAEDILDELARE